MRKALTTVAALGGIAAASLATATSANAATDTQWNKLANCESGGNWSINSGNGYYGGLQISPSTWRAFGGSQFATLPHRATREQQVSVAARIAASQGWNAWPSCSYRAGIRGSAATAPDASYGRLNLTASRSTLRAPIGSPTDPNKGGTRGKGKHVVRAGETLASIAKGNALPGGWQQLYSLNRSTIKNPNVLSVGQVLRTA